MDGAGMNSDAISLADGPAPARGGNRFARERRKAPRHSLDWFRTPVWATQALLEREAFPGAVWECAAGDGAMADPIAAAGYRVVASDVAPLRADVVPRDFLTEQALPDGCESVITNPPFRAAGDFVRHALALGVRKLAIIQRVAFLEGSERQRTIFASHPPARIWVFSRRVTMWKGDLSDQRDKGGAMAFCWLVFERHHQGTQVGWIP